MSGGIFRREKAGKGMLRQFGFLVGGIFGVIGVVLLLRDRDPAPYFLIIAAALILPAAILPGLLRPVHFVWMTIAEIMGWVMTRVILILLFFLVITPISLVSRLFGSKYLDLDFGEPRSSYWSRRTKSELRQSDYERQF